MKNILPVTRQAKSLGPFQPCCLTFELYSDLLDRCMIKTSLDLPQKSLAIFVYPNLEILANFRKLFGNIYSAAFGQFLENGQKSLENNRKHCYNKIIHCYL